MNGTQGLKQWIAVGLIAGMAWMVGGAAHAEEPADGGADAWSTDFEAAQAVAAEAEKDLLVLFTGSDWCVWCQRLEEQVLSQDAFNRKAPEDFVLVKLDYPRQTPQPEAVKARNRKLLQTYGVQGFPTVLLMNAGGEAYARTGYRPGGADAYLAHLDQLREQGAKVVALRAQADAAKGVERARLLAQWAELRQTMGLPFDAKAVYGEILTLLPEDGDDPLRADAEEKLFFLEFQGKLQAAMQQKRTGDALDLVNAALADRPGLSAEAKQQLQFLKAVLLFQSGKPAEALPVAEAAKKLDPDSPVAERLDQLIQAAQAQAGK